MGEEELRQENALNGMRARRFGGAINYARTRPAMAAQPAGLNVDDVPPVTQSYRATPVVAPAPTISTTRPAVPIVQPTAPTQAQELASQPTRPLQTMQQPVAPRQVTAQAMPARPGVTADPMTDPYAYIEQLYGRRETAAEKAERERKEFNRQKIANWVSMLGALGNMVATSSSRYGRAVKSPDFAKAAAHGILTNELQRRDNEQSRLEAIRHQQQLDAQREKMRRDADERAWNRKMKLRELDERQREQESANAFRRSQFDYQRQRDADRIAFEREEAKKDRAFRYSQLAEQRNARASREEINAFKAELQRRSREQMAQRRNRRDEIVLPHPNYPHGLRIAKPVWNRQIQRAILAAFYDEEKERHKQALKDWKAKEEETDFTMRHFGFGPSTEKPKNWFDSVYDPITGEGESWEDIITMYMNIHPNSEATKKAVNMLQAMSNDDDYPDYPDVDNEQRSGGNESNGDPDDSW